MRPSRLLTLRWPQTSANPKITNFAVHVMDMTGQHHLRPYNSLRLNHYFD